MRRQSRTDMANKTAGLLSRLSGGLTDGERVSERESVDLQLLIWTLTDRAAKGGLAIEDTNDMALIGNTVTFAANEAGDDGAVDKARAITLGELDPLGEEVAA